MQDYVQKNYSDYSTLLIVDWYVDEIHSCNCKNSKYKLCFFDCYISAMCCNECFAYEEIPACRLFIYTDISTQHLHKIIERSWYKIFVYPARFRYERIDIAQAPYRTKYFITVVLEDKLMDTLLSLLVSIKLGYIETAIIALEDVNYIKKCLQKLDIKFNEELLIYYGEQVIYFTENEINFNMLQVQGDLNNFLCSRDKICNPLISLEAFHNDTYYTIKYDIDEVLAKV